ncbi:unnamed protein product [Discula destructiva]
MTEYTASEPASASASATANIRASPSTPLSEIPHKASSSIKEEAKEAFRCSQSPLRPPPIFTDDLVCLRGAGIDDNALTGESPDSPLSVLSSPPDSPIDLTASAPGQDAGQANGYTNGDVKEQHTNGSVHEAGTSNDERPSKRRRVGRDSTPPPPGSKQRPTISPPWKKFEASGPTTIIEDGKRKSGRLNTVPLEQLSSDKRITRKSYSEVSPPSRTKSANRNGQAQSDSVAAKRAASASKTLASKTTNAAKHPARKSIASDFKSTPSKPPSSTQPSRSSTRTRRASRTGRDSAEPEPHALQHSRSNPRVRIHVNRPLTNLPVLHPQRVPREKLAPTLKEYFQIADKIPIADGGQLDPDEEPLLTDEQILAEARLIIRIEDEARPDGLLGDNCSVYQPEPAEHPPQHYAHQDHVIKAGLWLRRWMVKEQKDHREKAKKLAEACQAAWRARQPKTEEELEREARDQWIARYRVVMKVMFGTWENIRVEVNRRRLEEWEAEEQRRVKAALQEAVSRSEQQLLARQAQFDSDLTDDEHTDQDDDLASDEDPSQLSGESQDSDGASISGDDNMSSSDEDDDRKSVASDEDLTQEQLLAKYANLPNIQHVDDENDDDVKMAEPSAAADDDTSDESVDMDDDTEAESEDSSSGGDGESEEEDRPSGLLGLFFGKKELKKLQNEDNKPLVDQDDVEMVDADSRASTIADKLQSVGTDNKGADDSVAAGIDSSTIVQANQVNGDSKGILDVTPELSVKRRRAVTPDKSRVLPPPEVERLTPEAEAITNPATPDRSHSPETSDTKPSDADTATSVELLSAVQYGSRSASPQPNGPRTEVPFLLRGTLREYQHYGLDWLAGLYANSTNGILADEMGLGKTIQTIALLAHLACVHEVWGPHLIIVPTSVILNWEMEFKKWCPGFKILTYYGTQEERKRKRQGWKNDDVWNVCITSYQIVLQDAQVFRRRRWHYMILDEAHNIKNFKSQRWQTLLGFNTHSRLLLTGTPLQNNLTELWSLLFFLMPNEDGVGGFADLKEFHDWFARPESQILEHGREQMDEEARAIISKLHKVLRPYLLRRLKADVEKQMPAKIEHVEFCRLSKRQRELYDGFLARNETRDTLSSGNYLSIINCLMQLRKVCNHPDLFADRPIMTSFRMDKSVANGYEITERLVRAKLLTEDPMSKVNFGVMNMMPTLHEHLSVSEAERTKQLSAHDLLLGLRDIQQERAQSALSRFEPSTVRSNVASLDSRARWDRYQELLHLRYLNALGREQRPIYGKQLREFLTIGLESRPYRARPRVPKLVMSWFEEDSFILRTMIPTLDQRAQSLERTISKVACVTPAVVTRDMETLLLGVRGVEAFTEADLKLSAPVRHLPFVPPEAPIDPWHESRMRLSIQFPDKRLLQYDCGKLQALDRLLRKLQAGGHRALIFTQMTKVLDILEQFLNIHGHKYLRLDGSTKVEQRQILCDRFNADTRILAFILSSRSGGLGLNLTGADTVIFYDQDWNPAMDKQCQDRCHRIGQTRDVHIYRLVSEHTIEANILRKASQKQMLDDVVIQEGEFTTDYFKNNGQVTVQDVAGRLMGEHDEAANAAMDLVLGGVEKTDTRTATKALEQAEDTEDVIAARAAEKEFQQDDADFSETKPGSAAASTRQGTPREGSAVPSKAGFDLVAESTPAVEEAEPEYNAWGDRMRNIDEFMLGTMAALLEGTPLELPKDKKKSRNRKGRDHRAR